MGDISYEEANKRYDEFQKTNKLSGYTFDPTTSDGYDAYNKDDNRELLRRYSDGKNPLYIIATTNHQGSNNEIIHDAYKRLQNEGRHVFFGCYVNPDKLVYMDVSYPLNHGIDESEIEKLRVYYDQETYMKIDPKTHVTEILPVDDEEV